MTVAIDLHGWQLAAGGIDGASDVQPGSNMTIVGRILSSVSESTGQRRTISIALGSWEADTVAASPAPAASELASTELASTMPSQDAAAKDDLGSSHVEVDILINPQDTSAVAKAWLAQKKTSRLLCVGAEVQASGDLERDESTGRLRLTHCRRLGLVGAVPDPGFVMRCLQAESSLFGDGTNAAVSLASCLRPCTVDQLARLQQAILTDSAVAAAPFKSKLFMGLCDGIREAQCWTKEHRQQKSHSPKPRYWNATLRLEQRWQPCVRDGELDVDSSASLGIVDPMLNIPDPGDLRRRQYIDERKRPQVRWMLSMLQERIRRRRKIRPEGCLKLVDVGGGRGDLALAIASVFAGEIEIVVIDVNEKALAAGRERARIAELEGAIQFHSCNIESAADVARICADVDGVVGLHCCGGLSESAVSLAVRQAAFWIVCSCCFASNMQLAVLGDVADRLSGVEDHRMARLDACALAQSSQTFGQSRAQRAINTARLRAAEHLFEGLHGDLALDAWLAEYPKDFSKQNSVLVGDVSRPQLVSRTQEAA